MNHPKKIYLPDSENTLIWSESTNEITSKKHSYTSDEHLIKWIADEDKELEYAGLIRIEELLKFIE